MDAEVGYALTDARRAQEHHEQSELLGAEHAREQRGVEKFGDGQARGEAVLVRRVAKESGRKRLHRRSASRRNLSDDGGPTRHWMRWMRAGW